MYFSLVSVSQVSVRVHDILKTKLNRTVYSLRVGIDMRVTVVTPQGSTSFKINFR